MIRKGQSDAAIAHLVESAAETTDTHHALCHLKIARIHLDRGDPAKARNHTDQTRALGKDPARALLGIELALAEGRTSVAIKGCRMAIARATTIQRDPIRGTFLLRLGIALLDEGDRMGATQAIHKARDLLVRHGHRARLAEAHLYEAILALGRGHARTARVRVDPLITTARAFASERLLSRGWALKLRIASIMNDKAAARLALAGRSSQMTAGEDLWRMAQARWYRSQRDLPQAIHVADCTRSSTAASVSLALECASGLIASNQADQAKNHLHFAISTSKKRGYHELHTLAQLLLAGTHPDATTAWHDALHQARSGPWVELSMTAIAMEGRRQIARGDKDAARLRFQYLLERADHLDNHYHRVVANEALVQL